MGANGSVATEKSEAAEKVNRRAAKRHSCDGFAEVVVPYSGFLFRGEIADLSKLGCYVKTRARLNVKPSTHVELRFTVNSSRFSVLARTAVVLSGVGAGFEFSAIEPAMHKNLLQLIENLNAAESAPPEQSSDPASHSGNNA